jgi:protein-ribulosamine 3-kinase
MQSLLSHLNLNIKNVSPVHGGDINKTYCIEAEERKFFIKVNDAARYPSLFEKEANGLKALVATHTLPTPEVIKHGVADNLQYLLLDWIENGNTNNYTWTDFGYKLAQMHRQPQKAFGFAEDNYLGTYLQQNTFTDTWNDFYSQYRILAMIKLIRDQGKIAANTAKSAENFCSKLPEIFPGEPPALLHGDLWSGNYLINAKSEAALIDPAVYCGHREMDIGMSKLFGGFNEQFYSSYNEEYPLEKGWQQRLPYTQLYPLLFHAYAFGGSYVERVKQILKDF